MLDKMNTNKRLRFDEATLKQLGLMEEQEKFNFDEHRLASITLFSDQEITTEELSRVIIYVGYNQIANRATVVAEVGTELELSLANGKTKLIRVTQYGSTSKVDETIKDKFFKLRHVIPLRNPTLD